MTLALIDALNTSHAAYLGTRPLTKAHIDGLTKTWHEPVEVARNLFTNPRTAATGAQVFGHWAGSTPNAATSGYAAAPWALSGFCRYVDWSARSINSGDSGVNLIAKDGVKRTYVLTVVSSVSEPIRIAPNVATGTTVHAATSATTLVANQPTRIFCTLSVESGSTATRVSVLPNTARAEGSRISFADVDVYEGDYDPDRTPFSGASAPAGRRFYAWSGTPDASQSIAYEYPVEAAS